MQTPITLLPAGRRLLLTLALLPAALVFLSAQALLPPDSVRAEWRRNYWPASWITCPGASTRDWGVFHFRRTVRLDEAPARCVVHVSADNRYRLFVNGAELAHGPARDELDHWRYESIDIGPFLRRGENVIAAVVWNFGERRPAFQPTYQTAFLLQADDTTYHALNTGEAGWRAFANPAYAPETAGIDALRTYHVVGPGERLDAARYPWRWEQPGFDDGAWPAARAVEQAHPAVTGTLFSWGLTPRTLPAMEDRPVRLARARRVEADGAPPPAVGEAFLRGEAPLAVPPNSRLSILFDQGELTNAYPVLALSGGKGATVRLTYAESLYLPGAGNHDKGHRDSVAGKVMRGQQDVFLPDGGGNRTFYPLWFRTYRYLQLDVETAADGLTLHDLYGRFTGYPFVERARFAAPDPALADIWRAGWRTARLCAGETYYDCPYYEQLQYVGDTRIQALISLYVAGDDRLMRQAIDAYDHSRFANGLTHSRYPEGRPVQIIPPYSLFWVNMVHDFWRHRDDEAYVRGKLMGVQTVLHWFEQQIDPATGLIAEAPYWNFVDWAWSWSAREQLGGVPPLWGGSSILSLQLAYTLDDAAALFRTFGPPEAADRYARLSARLKERVMARCWDAGRGLLADTPARTSFSQHANILGVLTGAIPTAARRAVVERVLSEPGLTQATFYFQFYLFEAMRATGLADRYIDRLQPWRDMLALGLTTFAEEPDPTRSDCHAWSASPNYHLLSLVCGIRPAGPGFRTVVLEPALGDLPWVEGELPHPQGPLRVRWEKTAAGLQGSVVLPPGVSGTAVWKGKTVTLREGRQEVRLKG